MLQYDVLNPEGKILSKIVLLEKIFGIKPNQQVLYDVINKQRAAMRQGTHSTKNRSSVSGGGRKPWKQKGTGNARHGSIRSPLWRGGGVVFGPKPRNYDFKINDKVKKIAFYSALSIQTKRKNLIIIDDFKMESFKTKEFQIFLNNINVKGKILFIVKELDENLIRSTNNLSNVTLESVSHVSVYQIMNTNYLVMTKESILYFEEVFK
ncbi:MAG: 50S ribosomal protein L4 [Candidatus Phytoplasma cynodontis]|uniref:50S ribosomal protein L4 n=1 Tax='Cynodon dactylon' phytoplasma TaxID=295320 RepID=UPI001265B0DF|nr:50S ribosomal protein L4 ['Cynodon dactylon' phytoplasma]KAB8121985.1 50S ribosomal protein L4 ['Cynodon dactylon' phytoplasma]WIA07600.1 MAG: 50S ribosomal protein L4 [Candidatus Phytoplasma cynodontis]